MPRQIGYISPDIPRIAFPPSAGERYRALAPDTLDLAARAELAIRGLTNVADPDAGYEIWWFGVLNHKPPSMTHDFHDLNIQYKFQEALPLLRSITGSGYNLEVDQGWAEALLRMQGEDGLIYMPIEGRPWARLHADWLGERGLSKSTQLASTVANGGWMGVLGLYYLLSGDPVWKRSAQRLIDRMAQLVTRRDDYGFYAVSAVDPGATVPADLGLVDPSAQSEVGFLEGWIVNGLCQAYVATGYEPALDLAGPLSVYLKDHSGYFDREGNFLGAPHTHLHTRPLSGLLEYALITGNREMIDFCRNSYELMKRWAGSTTLGFFPGTPGPDAHPDFTTIQRSCRNTVEGCTIADVVALAIKLSQAGLGDYWDDAERYLRNQFAEMQIIRTDWADRTPPAERTEKLPDPACESTDRAVERNVGNCMSLASPNDFLGHGVYPNDRPRFDELFLMHCCTGNYARAIWYAWDHILTFADGVLKVNMLLNRASPWADVASYLPYEGQVDVQVKQACRLAVHIPEWTKPEETAVTVNGQVRMPGWSGRYAQVGEVKPGDAVTLQWPIGERIVREKLWATDYTLILKGNTVVLIDPPGRYYPFYQRDHYREDRVRWVRRERFVASRSDLHWHY